MILCDHKRRFFHILLCFHYSFPFVQCEWWKHIAVAPRLDCLCCTLLIFGTWCCNNVIMCNVQTHCYVISVLVSFSFLFIFQFAICRAFYFFPFIVACVCAPIWFCREENYKRHSIFSSIYWCIKRQYVVITDHHLYILFLLFYYVVYLYFSTVIYSSSICMKPFSFNWKGKRKVKKKIEHIYTVFDVC